MNYGALIRGRRSSMGPFKTLSDRVRTRWNPSRELRPVAEPNPASQPPRDLEQLLRGRSYEDRVANELMN